MLLQIQMSNNHIQKIIDDDSYEILELDAPEPIIFEANKKYEQHIHIMKRTIKILIVPRESQTRLGRL